MSESQPLFPPLTGGIPIKSQDFVASIIFTVLFGLLSFIAICRMAHPSSRSMIILRPLAFCLAQVAAYALRADFANGNENKTVYEISEILLLAGFILICEPTVGLLTRIVGSAGIRELIYPRSSFLQRLLSVFRLVLLVALIVAILAATDISSNESPSDMHHIKTYRSVNAAFAILGVGGSFLIGAWLWWNGSLPQQSFLLLSVLCFELIATATYKLANVLHPGGDFSLDEKVLFYIFNSALQWLITVTYFAFNLNVYFVEEESSKKQFILPMSQRSS